ncbi:MAG: PKD domain-containing protein, partial [Bacteroidota bacterium]
MGYRLSASFDALPGVYLDTVWVEGFIGLNTRIFNRQYIFEITISEPLEPVAEFTVNRDEVLEGSTIEFSNLSINAVTDWKWEFGDGGISTAFDTTYTFMQAGTYSVLLIARGPAGTDSITKEIQVYPQNQQGIWNWSFDAIDRVSAPISSDLADRIFFTDYDDYLYGLNRFGEEIWRTLIPASRTSSPVIGPGNTLFIAAKESNTVSVLYAINSNIGNRHLSVPLFE